MKRRRKLSRAVLLLAATFVLSPIGPILLVVVPLALVLVSFRWGEPRPVMWAVLLLGVVALYAAGLGVAGGDDAPLRFAELGWCVLVGGTFVAASASGTGRTMLDKALAAVAGAGGIVLVLGLLRPGLLSGVDWASGAETWRAATTTYPRLVSLGGARDGAWVERLGSAMLGWVGFQQAVYPAFLALASVTALAGAWLLGGASDDEIEIGRIREFRFNDQLVWLLVAGLALLVLPFGRGASRLGENAALFMGVLYLVRGAAVLWWAAAMVVKSTGTAILLVLLALLLYPVVAGTALVLGLSDTWIDLRGRMRRSGLADGAP